MTPPIPEGGLPEPLCVVQICLEGKISRQSVLNQLSRGSRPSGDLIPWLVSQQFQDDEFASLSGARIVRIATSPEYIQMGYGSRALELLVDYYEGKFANLSEEAAAPETMARVSDAELAGMANDNLLHESIKVRDPKKMPPLFSFLDQRRPESLDYLGTSYGLTQPLHHFWKRASFTPVYLRQTANDLTGEHTCVMLRPLRARDNDDASWVGAFANDFRHRLLTLLSYQFREFPSVMALSIIESAQMGAKLDSANQPTPLAKQDLDRHFSPWDQKRLESYGNNMLDYHVILDLLPALANLYFNGNIQDGVKISGIQRAVLLAIGLQRKDIDVVADELTVPSQQLLAMFMKIIRKITAHFGALVSGAIEAQMPDPGSIGVSRENAAGIHDDEIVETKFVPLEKPLDEELEEGGDEELKEWRAKQRELIDSLPLDQYVHSPVLTRHAQVPLKLTKDMTGSKSTVTTATGPTPRRSRSRLPRRATPTPPSA